MKHLKKFGQLNEGIIRPTGDWKAFDGEELPTSLVNKFKKVKEKRRPGNMFDDLTNGFGNWVQGAVYFKGSDNIEDAKEWIITTDNGSYYKVQAEYIVWKYKDGENKYSSQAIWSTGALKKCLLATMVGKSYSDPDYQT